MRLASSPEAGRSGDKTRVHRKAPSWQALLESALDVDELVAIAQELIRCPSVNPPGNEELVARVIANHLKQAGARDITTVTATKGRESVLARWGRPGGRVLVWNGHTDVVPTADVAQWRHAPFSAVVTDGRLWGRGATDMKGSIAAVLGALSMIDRAGLELQGEVVASFVGDEECGGSFGSGYLYERGMFPRADAGICGEPTGFDVVTVAQGRLWIEVTTFGTSAHAVASPSWETMRSRECGRLWTRSRRRRLCLILTAPATA